MTRLQADSSQVTKGQGQDKRRTAALDPLRPVRWKVTKGRYPAPMRQISTRAKTNLRITLDTTQMYSPIRKLFQQEENPAGRQPTG